MSGPADIPVPGGLRHACFPDPHPSALPADLPEEPNQGFFFSHFSPFFFFFKVRQLLLVRGRGCPRTGANPRGRAMRSSASLMTVTSIMKMMRRCG